MKNMNEHFEAGFRKRAFQVLGKEINEEDLVGLLAGTALRGTVGAGVGALAGLGSSAFVNMGKPKEEKSSLLEESGKGALLGGGLGAARGLIGGTISALRQ